MLLTNNNGLGETLKQRLDLQSMMEDSAIPLNNKELLFNGESMQKIPFNPYPAQTMASLEQFCEKLLDQQDYTEPFGSGNSTLDNCSMLPAMEHTELSIDSDTTCSSNPVTEMKAEDIYKMCKEAQATRDPCIQLELCKKLMNDTHLSDYSDNNYLSSSANSSFSTIENCDNKKTKKEKTPRNVIAKEVLFMLHRLAMTGQSIGKCANSEAQFILANYLGMGSLGLKANHKRAFQLYVQASKQSHPEATYRAGVCYEIGLGTRKDSNRAMVFYRKAAHLSHPASMYKLGMILLHGYCKQAAVMREAICWLQRAAQHATPQVPHALHTLAMIQITGELGESTSMLPDPIYAVELLLKAASFDYAPSQVKLGECYEKGTIVNPNESMSIYWYARAAKQGRPEGALGISTWYLTGTLNTEMLKQSDTNALLWAEKAVSTALAMKDDGRGVILAKALYTVGFYIEHGIGIEAPSPEKAAIWYSKSAAHGHKDAMDRLKKTQAKSIPCLAIEKRDLHKKSRCIIM